MKDINIARVLVKKRREKGITQEALAAFIGVSKASVSKWETGQSYPDITFLPRLAAYFGITVDDLIGYAPQVTKAARRALYQRLAAGFATAPFDVALDAVREAAHTYFASFPVQFDAGLLLFNHHMLADTPEKASAIIEEARAFFARVYQESGEMELGRQAVSMEALCLLTLRQPEAAIALLGEGEEAVADTEILAAAAWRMMDKPQQAARLLQKGTFKAMLTLLELLSHMLDANMDDPARFVQVYARALAVEEAFAVGALHPSVLMKLHLAAAAGFCVQGKVEQALKALEAYTDIVTGDIYPLRITGDDFFDTLDDWLDTFDPPRDERTIKQGFVDAVKANPAFAVLEKEARYAAVLRRLEGLIKREGNG